MAHGKYYNIVIACLIAISVAVMILQEYSLNDVYVIDSSSDKKILSPMFNGFSDGTDHKGQSIVSYKIEQKKVILDCEIVISDYPWPYCELSITLHNGQSQSATLSRNTALGVDLSLFKYVKVYAEYENISKSGIRFYTRNYDEKISSVLDRNSWQYNGIEFNNKKVNEPVIIPLALLQVPSWWLLENDIPLERSITSFKKVMELGLVTGDQTPPGHYRIILDRLEFHGKYFQTENVYIGIIFLWLFTAICIILYRLHDSKNKLLSIHRKAEDLKKLNRLLHLENDSLKDKPNQDTLTGVFNRLGIQSVITRDIPVLSFIFSDIDLFKAINDNYGRDIGDEILVSFSKLICEYSRATDVIARWGWDQFLLASPDTDKGSAIKLAENLRALIEHYSWPHDIKLTASFGVADRVLDESHEEFIHRTDKALYAAKVRGRNRVISS
jgi:diguanylate cyclase (GGDEF)-like protein